MKTKPITKKQVDSLRKTLAGTKKNIKWKDIDYDVLVFFSPSGIKSLLQNFPDFEQKETLIASFGPATAKAVKEAGLRLDIQAPMPQAPSMTAALEMYIKKHNKK